MPNQPAIPGFSDAMKKMITQNERLLAELDAVAGVERTALALLHKLAEHRISFSSGGPPHSVRDGYAERGIAVQDYDADLQLGDLWVEVPHHQPLTQQVHTKHLRFDAASVWYPLHRRRGARPGNFNARRASFRATAPAVTAFHGLVFLRGGNVAWAQRSVMVSWNLRVS